MFGLVDLTHIGEDHMRHISAENVAHIQSNLSSKHSDYTDVGNASVNCETESGCRNGCQTPTDRHISTLSRGRVLPPSSIRDDDSLTTLSISSSSSVTETGSRKTNCSTSAHVDVDKGSMMTSSACAVRETAIMGDSSDERLDRIKNCTNDVISGASLIRQPLSRTNSSRQSQASSDLLRRDFASCLDYAPETDILFSESDVERNPRATPEVETYLRLPPMSPYNYDANRSDNLLLMQAAGQNESMENRQVDVVEQPEVNSTTTTTTTTNTLSMSRRSSSVGALNHLGMNCDVRPSSSVHRHFSVRDRRRRIHSPEAEVGRRMTSPVDRNAVTAAALSVDEARRSHDRAIANWSKLREQLAADDPHLRAATLRLLEEQVGRSRSFDRQASKRLRPSRSSDRQASRRVRRSSSSRDRRRCISTGASTSRKRSKGVSPSGAVDGGNASNISPFHPASDLHPQLLATERVPIPIHGGGSMDDVSATVDITGAAASGSALPYDYEPLSFDDYGGRSFAYTDDPFDYDDSGGHDGGKVTVPITVCLIIIAGYIFAGAVLFTLWEDWDYLTGSYFCFITLSTIGFGDIVPGTDMDKWASSEKLVLCALWLAFGLSLLAMCFNLMQEEVKEKCKWIGLRVGLLRDDEPQ